MSEFVDAPAEDDVPDEVAAMFDLSKQKKKKKKKKADGEGTMSITRRLRYHELQFLSPQYKPMYFLRFRRNNEATLAAR